MVLVRLPGHAGLSCRVRVLCSYLGPVMMKVGWTVFTRFIAAQQP